ncbi:MAG: hypothetical protein ABL958_19590, partial [Bdellovibrionia bacterium]
MTFGTVEGLFSEVPLKIRTWIAAVLSFAATAWMVSKIFAFEIAYLNSSLLFWKFDGLKNYYTYLYHLKYGSSYLHFTGMNYPFGEHVVFTDNQPFLSVLLRWFSLSVFDLRPWSLGILNGLMLVSLPLSAFFISFLLRRFGVRGFMGVGWAMAIAFLAPQNYRLMGHFALSYSFVIPAAWLLLLRYFEKPTFCRSFAFAAWTLWWAGIHFYYLALLGFFSVVMWLSFFLLRRKPVRLDFIHIAIQGVMPLALIKIWMSATDSATDRMVEGGFFYYRSFLDGIFFPPV